MGLEGCIWVICLKVQLGSLWNRFRNSGVHAMGLKGQILACSGLWFGEEVYDLGAKQTSEVQAFCWGIFETQNVDLK